MAEMYVPSQELAKLAIEKTVPVYKKMIGELLIPSNYFLIVSSAGELGLSPWELKRRLASGLKNEGRDLEEIDSMKAILADNLSGAIETICFMNVSFEHSSLEERIKIHNEHGYPQVPGNPKISIISDLRDCFSHTVYQHLKQIIPFKDSESFLKYWSNDFYDFVSKNGPVKQNPSGVLYFENGRVYFKTEVSLPKKPAAGNAIAVDGIAKERTKIRRDV